MVKKLDTINVIDSTPFGRGDMKSRNLKSGCPGRVLVTWGEETVGLKTMWIQLYCSKELTNDRRYLV